MDFLFHVPFLCTSAAAVVTEILNICLVNIEFCQLKKLILNQFSYRQNSSGLSPSSAQTARINAT
jgi:hypothetical protein